MKAKSGVGPSAGSRGGKACGLLFKEFSEIMWGCYDIYAKEYGILGEGARYKIAHTVRIQKTEPGQGYHLWHYENGEYETRDRFLAYMTYLQAPSEGGETEFLLQSKRIDPVVGRTLIWPPGFTHKHRGNPPLKGEKIYITGWFNMSPFTPFSHQQRRIK